MTLLFRSSSEEETAAIARRLAPILRAGDLVTFEGPLGAGKSVFVRALVRALTGNAREEAPSPTFTLTHEYETAGGIPLIHADLYRLGGDPLEILELGFEEAREGGILLVEWPDRFGSFIGEDALAVKIEPEQGETRCIRLEGYGMWRERLEQSSIG